MTVDVFNTLDPENQMGYLRGVFTDLRGFHCVDIHYERDYRTEKVTGVNHAQFEITIDVGPKQVRVENPSLISALVEAYEIATSIEQEQEKQEEERKNQVLARLSTMFTPEELRLVGIRP
jgi:hypothetical protein